MNDIAAQKMRQAFAILEEKNLDCWLMLDRESGTMGHTDPSLDLLLPTTIIGLTAFLLTRHGKAVAVAASYDTHNLKGIGLFDRVIPYELDIREPLVKVLHEIDPDVIGVNDSEEDFVADGLTTGLMRKLSRMLEGTPYAKRIASAEDVASSLRSRKIGPEIEAIRGACDATREIWKELTCYLKPGITEMQAMTFIHHQCERLGVKTAWDSRWCPGITAGPSSVGGHNPPSDQITLKAGTLFSIDFGVRRDGYVSDLQRTWYVPSASQPQPPGEVTRAGATLRKAIWAAREAMRPGVPGYEIDAVARGIITEAGYPEYKHALGHQVGRSAHDGGTLLGPAHWPRYAEKSQGLLEIGNVFTIEPGIQTSLGRYGTEEMVIMTESGAEWITEPQREIWLTQA